MRLLHKYNLGKWEKQEQKWIYSLLKEDFIIDEVVEEEDWVRVKLTKK